MQRHTTSRRRRQPARRLAGPIGIGAAAGAAAAAGVMFGRKAVTAAKIGQGHPLKHRLLDLAAGVIQPKYPLDAVSTYLNGFHLYADEMGRQVEAAHFCIHLRHDLHQCVIFDRNAPDARLIGIEYIISQERFRGLPDDEKRLWHSHHYEVKSGTLTAPERTAAITAQLPETEVVDMEEQDVRSLAHLNSLSTSRVAPQTISRPP